MKTWEIKLGLRKIQFSLRHFFSFGNTVLIRRNIECRFQHIVRDRRLGVALYINWINIPIFIIDQGQRLHADFFLI